MFTKRDTRTLREALAQAEQSSRYVLSSERGAQHLANIEDALADIRGVLNAQAYVPKVERQKKEEGFPVHFKRWASGEVIALFPESSWPSASEGRMVGSYMHVGQHSSASPELLKELPDATEEEYTPLFKELEEIGYQNLTVLNKLDAYAEAHDTANTL